eukprot:GILI01029311.1.p1 GENE.GILI01029311.1~~GILI01029311.1.p1  ORF type:complete len:163 (-),score=15.16 GILI01029311.1:96-557(-)
MQSSDAVAPEQAVARPEQVSTSRFSKFISLFKGLTMKELIFRYGLPLAGFYWVFNKFTLAFFVYIIHFNYISQNTVIGILDTVGLGSWVDTNSLHLQNIEVGPFTVSALLLANLSVAAAFNAIVFPIKLPLCIWLYTLFMRLIRRPVKALKVD